MKLINFEQARAKLAAATGKPAAEYGWENDEVFLVAHDYGDDMPPFDNPDYLVDKATGELREIYGMPGDDPVPGLRPITNPPNA